MPEPPDDPGPRDPDFIQLTKALRAAAERAKGEKAEVLREWSEEQSDEEILAEYGINMDELRKDL